MKHEFTPKLFTLLKQGIPKETILKDLLSGIIVGIVALPLAIAFAIASGISPEKGIITAIIAGIVISLLGGSRVQIGGPTGAFIVIVYGIVQNYGVAGLTIATFIAGFLIILMGIAKLGNYLKFIPYSLIVGFTSGIAVIIFSSQINDFFGLGFEKTPSDFIEKWFLYFSSFNLIDGYSLAIAAGTVLIMTFSKKVTKIVPGALIAIVLATVVVQVFQIPVETIETRFGKISSSIGAPSIPKLDYQTIKALIQPAFAIALLGGIESLLSAVVSDSMIGGKHRPNAELVAQGIANIASSLFGGIPATGAIARTATNVKNGGRTPIAGIVHGIVLLAILLIFASYAELIPLSCLAGVLVIVAYQMSGWRQFISILKGNKMDTIILLTTFFLTVLLDLVIAIEIGIVLSSFMFMKRMSSAVQVQHIMADHRSEEALFDHEAFDIPKGVVLYEINGPLFFGAARHFQEALTNSNTNIKVIIIRMRYVPMIDATGFQSLKEIITIFKERQITVILSGIKDLRKDFVQNDMFLTIDEQFVVEDITKAIEKAKEIL